MGRSEMGLASHGYDLSDETMDNDLEDGEIEDDDDDIVEVTEKENVEIADTDKANTNTINTEKTNKSPEKDSRGGHRDRRRDRSTDQHYNKEKPRKRPIYEPEDDWAGDVEKAIASVIKKKELANNANKSDAEKSDVDSQDERRRGKKRKRRERAKERKKKHRNAEIVEKPNPPTEEEIDEDELLCIRGGSPKPAPKPPADLAVFPNEDPSAYGHYVDYDSYSSDYDSEPYVSPRRNRRGYDRERDRKNRDRDRSREGSRRERKNRSEKNRGERRSEKARPVAQDSTNICLFYMQGKCHKGEECPYSHAAVPQMKLELCKFYLMECCAKRDKCLYMHSEFPCKFYHTGLHCVNGDRGQCKFAHGAPLNDNLKQVLLKHLEMAPKEILGDFPRFSREGAQSLVNATQKKLEQQYGMSESSNNAAAASTTSSNPAIPSLFEISITLPQSQPGLETPPSDSKPTNTSSNTSTTNSQSSRTSRNRPSRWGSEKEKADVSEIISKLIPTTKPISDVGISNVVTSVYSTLSVQDQEKLRQYQLNFNFPGFYSEKDQDMRVTSNGDIDMRSLNIPPPIQVVGNVPDKDKEKIQDDDNIDNGESQKSVEKTEEEKAMADLDLRQFPVVLPSTVSAPPMMLDTKDDNDLNDSYDDERELQIDDVPLEIDIKDEDEKPASDTDELPSNLPLKQRELFLRIKAQQKENKLAEEEKSDTDKNDDQEDDWYSDDDDDDDKDERNSSNKDTKQDLVYQPPEIKMSSMEPLTLQSSNSINAFSELSKVDISAKVTQLLSLVKSQTQQSMESTSNKSSTPAPVPVKTETAPTVAPTPVLSDPRSLPRDPRQQPASGTSPASRRDDPRVKRKLPSPERVHPVSIYELGSLEPQGDVDLRSDPAVTKDFDMRLGFPTDLRNSRSDVDLRSMSLPFKAMPNYVPATEIDASINSHPPMVYRVHVCDIPRPDYSGLKLNAKDAQASSDPRIRKIFRLSSKPVVPEIPEIASPEPMTSPKSNTTPTITSPPSISQRESRVDPRMQRKAASAVHLDPTVDSIIHEMDYDQQLQLLQNSAFYQGLTSNQKLVLNQAIATQKDQQNSMKKPKQMVLETILSNLGLAGTMAQPNPGMMNPAMNFMSSLFGGSGNFNPNMGGGPNMGPSSGMGGMVPPSLLGPGPTSGMNMAGPMQGMNDDFHSMGAGNYGNMRGGNVGGLLGHSPFQQNMPMGGGPGPGFNMGPDGDYSQGQFNPDGFGNQFFGGNSGGGNMINNDFNNGPNRRNERQFKPDRPNRRGRGGNWNAGSNRHQGNRGNFAGRNRNNRTNRSRTPP